MPFQFLLEAESALIKWARIFSKQMTALAKISEKIGDPWKVKCDYPYRRLVAATHLVRDFFNECIHDL